MGNAIRYTECSDATPNVANEKCGNCGGKLNTTGSPKWCKDCRNNYQRDYKDKQLAEAKAEGFTEGFAAGYAECRLYLMQHFNPHPLGQFRGIDILNYLREIKPPSSRNGADVERVLPVRGPG